MQSSAFYALLDEVISHIDENFKLSRENRWIDPTEAMRLLNIRSKTTLQELRDSGRVAYTQPMHKVILYDRESIMRYLESHVRETF